MTDPTALQSLADRVEGAAGPDQRLDCLIETALGLAKFKRDPRVGYGDADYSRAPPKAYTGSIDAAMMLLPNNLRLVVLCDLADGSKSSWAAKLGNRNGAGGLPACGAATPALTLCAAALRAIASQENGNGQ